jgi:hypothetical protein
MSSGTRDTTLLDQAPPSRLHICSAYRRSHFSAKMKRPWSQTLSTLLPRNLIRELKLSDADVFADLSESECDAEAYVQTP